MEIEILFDDGRPGLRYDDDVMGDSSWAWDQKHIASTLVARRGFPKGEPRAIGVVTRMRRDLFDTQGIRIDVSWVDNAVDERSVRDERWRGFDAVPEPARYVILAGPEDVPHVSEVDVDGEPAWLHLCRGWVDCAALRRARRNYAFLTPRGAGKSGGGLLSKDVYDLVCGIAAMRGWPDPLSAARHVGFDGISWWGFVSMLVSSGAIPLENDDVDARADAAYSPLAQAIGERFPDMGDEEIAGCMPCPRDHAIRAIGNTRL